jgi:hypothetical protein
MVEPGSHRDRNRFVSMHPQIAQLLQLANQIALTRARIAYVPSSELRSIMQQGVARLESMLDGLIDDTEDTPGDMPWWTAWRKAGL